MNERGKQFDEFSNTKTQGIPVEGVSAPEHAYYCNGWALVLAIGRGEGRGVHVYGLLSSLRFATRTPY